MSLHNFFHTISLVTNATSVSWAIVFGFYMGFDVGINTWTVFAMPTCVVTLAYMVHKAAYP